MDIVSWARDEKKSVKTISAWIVKDTGPRVSPEAPADDAASQE